MNKNLIAGCILGMLGVPFVYTAALIYIGYRGLSMFYTRMIPVNNPWNSIGKFPQQRHRRMATCTDIVLKAFIPLKKQAVADDPEIHTGIFRVIPHLRSNRTSTSNQLQISRIERKVIGM